MAPVLRSRRTPGYSQPALFAGPINTTGLAALPPELLLEIVNCFRSIRTPWAVTKNPLSRAQRDRQAIIRTLSQLCRSFRQTLLPFVWRNIEVCTVKEETWAKRSAKFKSIDGARYATWQKELAYDLINQLETVTIRNPQYATHVQNVCVIITCFSLPTVLPEFAKCLSLLPNLKVLQLQCEVSGGALQKAFHGYEYKGIRTVVIPFSNAEILRACPSVHWLHLTHASSRTPRPSDDRQKFKSVHKLTGISKPFVLSSLVPKLPKLKHVQLIASGTYAQCTNCIEQLSKLLKLQTIEIRCSADCRVSKEELEELEKRARDVLKNLPVIQGVKRTVRLRPPTLRTSNAGGVEPVGG
ncbi:hypothetical protein BDN72DRAFT_830724 [Pluteus cervinus]|uniref:Uncharacterized protein n=1 Tax=Pluteus cervinus TaxID=181527 RepID=A0ACD3BF17_9AGAR|nr:hypothetical protein BDN72DRAFT_830724 [Pluteus cervinus]